MVSRRTAYVIATNEVEVRTFRAEESEGHSIAGKFGFAIWLKEAVGLGGLQVSSACVFDTAEIAKEKGDETVRQLTESVKDECAGRDPLAALIDDSLGNGA